MLVEERISIGAVPDRVWRLIANPERMSAFSPELHHIQWIGDPTPRVGGTFRAFNRVGPIRWRTRNVIEVADPRRLFAWRAMDGPGFRFVTRWTYCLRPANGQCEVVERCETASWLAAVITKGLLWGRARMLRRGMRTTLEAIKVAAEA
ncbi:MAG: SRPBCC family protein [Candidatus Dormibacteraceae bacterium]